MYDIKKQGSKRFNLFSLFVNSIMIPVSVMILIVIFKDGLPVDKVTLGFGVVFLVITPFLFLAIRSCIKDINQMKRENLW